MPEYPPPAHARPAPVLITLYAGAALWRAHKAKRQHQPFKDKIADPQFNVGRFDAMPPEEFSFCCLGLSPSTAVMETYVRSVPANDTGERLIKRRALRTGRLTGYELTRDLRLVALRTAAELGAVYQDRWLLDVEGNDHAKTRRWAQWIRQHTPQAQGLLWPAKREAGGSAVILFGDRCGPDDVLRQVGEPVDLIDAEGDGAYVNTLLAAYRLAVAPRRAMRPALVPGVTDKNMTNP
jgi:hypothetical protein